VIAVFVHPRLKVDAVDGPDIGEIVPVQLPPVAAINLRFPELVHLHVCGNRVIHAPLVSICGVLSRVAADWLASDPSGYATFEVGALVYMFAFWAGERSQGGARTNARSGTAAAHEGRRL